MSDLDDKLKEALYTYNMDTTAGGMDEEKATSYYLVAVKKAIKDILIEKLGEK